MMRGRWLVLVGLAWLLGCGGGGGGSSPLTGWIESHPFTFASGQATSMPNGYFIRLFGNDSGSCTIPPTGDSFDLYGVPNAVGIYQLGPDLTATFDDGDSITVMMGQIAITSITATTISGSADVDDGSGTGNVVHGNFHATICP